jgi:acyl-coenzyme A synthetase/AMP-(fatty) acid ligase
VAQACVVPVADEVRGQMPIAFVVLRGGADADEETLKRHALANGPAYQHPRRVFFAERLPLAGTNKIDRRALAETAAREIAAAAA